MKEEFESNESKRIRMLGENSEDKIHSDSETIKKGNFFENLWYFHKWKIILISIFAITFIIMAIQLANRKHYDMNIMYTGPKYIVGDLYNDISDAFLTIADDKNNDGKKELLFSTLVYQTEEQQKKNSNGNLYDIIVTEKANADNLNAFRGQIVSGQIVIFMLDPSLYHEYEGYFVKVSDVVGHEVDESILCGENGVYLRKTDFGKQFDCFNQLPYDTVLCVIKKITTTKDELQERSEEYFKRIVEFKKE